MNIVICWSGLSGYLGACWRALNSMPGINLRIFIRPSIMPYSDDVVKGLNITKLSDEALVCPAVLADVIGNDKVDVVVVSGWAIKSFVGLPFIKKFQSVPFVLAMDTPWRGDFRQKVAPYRLFRFIRRMSGAFVSGDRGARYAEYLGFSSQQIFSSIYGCDYDSLKPATELRDANGVWPRKFLYFGRYAKEKGLECLLEAYQEYKKRVDAPWTLSFYGSGALKDVLSNNPDVEECGFVQPSDLVSILAIHGAFVMPSFYEPWGVALAEAASSGLPLICSQQVCSSIDLVRHMYNGYVFAAGDAGELCNGLLWCHKNVDKLKDIGMYSQCYAGAYSSFVWADRWLSAFRKILNDSGL